MFKVGDKVRAYSLTYEYTGVITATDVDGKLRLQMPDWEPRWFHPKQCRRLVKRRRRRVWIPEYVLRGLKEDDPHMQAIQISLEKVCDDDVEFVEVRKKK